MRRRALRPHRLRLFLAVAAGLIAGSALATLPPPTPDEKAKAATKAEEKKARTEREKKALEEAQDRVVRRYRAAHPGAAVPDGAVTDKLRDSDVPSGAKALDVPHPDTGR